MKARQVCRQRLKGGLDPHEFGDTEEVPSLCRDFPAHFTTQVDVWCEELCLPLAAAQPRDGEAKGEAEVPSGAGEAQAPLGSPGRGVGGPSKKDS